MVSISVLCAETEEKALQLRKLANYNLLRFEQGRFEPMSSYEDIKNYHFSQQELERIQYNSGKIISGSKEQVKQQLVKLTNDFDISEIIVTTMTYSREDRLHSFELWRMPLN